MRTGQHVRVRPDSSVAQQHRLGPDLKGVVICQYTLLARGPAAPEKLDVRFAENHMVWGVPADAFEEIEELDGKSQ